MIVTDQDLKTWLGISSLTDVAILARQTAENHVKEYIGTQEIEQQTWVEYYPLEYQPIMHEGDPRYILDTSGTYAVPLQYGDPKPIQLRQFLPRSVTEVRQDPTGYFGQVAGSFPSSTILQSGIDYFLLTEQSGISWTGQLVRRAFWWPSTPGSLQISYIAGLTPAELAGRWSCIKRACLEELSDIYIRSLTVQGGQRPDIQSQGLGGGASTTFLDNHESGLAVCDRAAEQLQPFLSYAEMAI